MQRFLRRKKTVGACRWKRKPLTDFRVAGDSRKAGRQACKCLERHGKFSGFDVTENARPAAAGYSTATVRFAWLWLEPTCNTTG